MDGDFFMGKQIRRLVFLALAVGMTLTVGLLRDSAKLREDILRLHVVAASDGEADQNVKLQVRDAILGSLEEGLSDLTDPEQVFSYVQTMLPKLEQTANRVLEEAGFDDTAKVSLTEESFPIREYDTFSLPSGIYHSLRVVIGEGEGHNWWCVVFPQLCTGADAEKFERSAKDAGLSDSLRGSLTGEYEIRFWLLDQLGRIENFWADALN